MLRLNSRCFLRGQSTYRNYVCLTFVPSLRRTHVLASPNHPEKSPNGRCKEVKKMGASNISDSQLINPHRRHIGPNTTRSGKCSGKRIWNAQAQSDISPMGQKTEVQWKLQRSFLCWTSGIYLQNCTWLEHMHTSLNHTNSGKCYE